MGFDFNNDPFSSGAQGGGMPDGWSFDGRPAGGGDAGGAGGAGEDRTKTTFAEPFKVEDPFRAGGPVRTREQASWDQPRYDAPRKRAKPPRTYRGTGGGVPRNLLLAIGIIAAFVILCVVFREQISAFVEQLLTWVLTIALILVIVRYFIFRRR